MFATPENAEAAEREKESDKKKEKTSSSKDVGQLTRTKDEVEKESEEADEGDEEWEDEGKGSASKGPEWKAARNLKQREIKKAKAKSRGPAGPESAHRAAWPPNHDDLICQACGRGVILPYFEEFRKRYAERKKGVWAFQWKCCSRAECEKQVEERMENAKTVISQSAKKRARQQRIKEEGSTL